MLRRFRQHTLRRVADLSGIWDFAFLGDIDPDTVDVASLSFDDRMAVPGCFDATPGYAGQRGLTAYRTRVTLDDTTPYRLVFDGVHHWCRVFAGDVALRDHVGGFTRFHADSTNHAAGEIDLTVLVDNRIDYQRCPLHLEYFDWYHFGGIARPVALHRLGNLWIDSLRVVTTAIDPPTLDITINYRATAAPGTTDLAIDCDGHSLLHEQVDLASTSGTIVRTVSVPGAALWYPEQPALHMLGVRLGADDLYERVGLRTIRVDDTQIMINERPTRLLGFCRHESHPQFGCAQPEGLLVADIQQLRDMGCTFVRGSHYPQDPRFLDLCDEAGICVWNEAIGWQHTAEHLNDSHFLQAQLAHIDEMVAMSCNHASVIMWGLLNESESHDPATRPGYRTLISRLRELDSTRPITYASNHPFDDHCLDLVDIVSINSYPGWYYGTIDDIPAALDRIIAHVDNAGHAGKPIIISEIGAGAIPGWRDWNELPWTEQYQARLLDMVVRYLFADRNRVCGLSIWLYNDFRTTEEQSRILRRPRGYNDKGVVDEYRRPKQAYEVVRAHYRSLRQLQ